MKTPRWNINAIFLCAFILLLAGCQTTSKKKDKEETLISLHLETNPDGSTRNTPVPIYRSRPMMVNVTVQPFLTNQDIESASIVDVEGGFAIQLKFNEQAARALDIVSIRNRGKRVAVNSAFPNLRWLAAPIMNTRLGNGVFIFTPDATREETERIVLGINNVAKKIGRNQLLK